jgi:hypothetical protein
MRLSNQQRIESINVFNDNKFNGVKNKYFVVSNALKSLNIKFIRLYINIINQVE